MSDEQPNEDQLDRIWGQSHTPVAFRQRRGKVGVRLPFDKGNRDWLRNGRRHQPEWRSDRRRWDIPKAWFNDFVDRALQTYGRVYIIQPFRSREVCAPACRNAIGHECECSCMGENHGAGVDDGMVRCERSVLSKMGRETIRLPSARCDRGQGTRDAMTAEECITIPARLSRRLAIEINLTRTGHMHVEWDPAVPKRLTRKEHRAYLRARDEAASRLADLVGGAVLVVTL